MHWLVKEVRRIHEELDRVRAPSGEQQLAREPLPTLRRDPRSGEWRVT
jgi:hypothetical protein